jgi:hypothetical protein
MITVAFDVDGTLIDENDEPRSDILTMLFLLNKYCHILVWSGSGVGYAQMWGNRLCLPDNVEYASKTQDLLPDVAFDDVETFNKALAIIKV